MLTTEGVVSSKQKRIDQTLLYISFLQPSFHFFHATPLYQPLHVVVDNELTQTIIMFTMSTKYFCDICKKEVRNPVRVGWRREYCEKCWKDKKNWSKIHSKKIYP